MERSSVIELRRVLVKELAEYKGSPVKLNLDSDVLEEILFEHHYGEKEGHYKDFADELSNDYSPCDILRKIDFTGVSFKNFRCYQIGNGYTGITINPQEVYRKDLSSAKLGGVFIELDERGFKDVRIFSTSFKGAKKKDGSLITINPQEIKNRLMADCVFDGIVFTGGFAGVNIIGSDFRGSTGAVIDPQTIYEKRLDGTKLGGVRFINSFIGAYIANADFTGSMNATINPQTIKSKSLTDTILKDAYIVGEDMNGVVLNNTDFRGHKGNVIINPQMVANKKLTGCKLSAVTITGPLDDCVLLGTDFTGSTGGYYRGSNYGLIDKTTNLSDIDVSKIKREQANKERNKMLILSSIGR